MAVGGRGGVGREWWCGVRGGGEVGTGNAGESPNLSTQSGIDVSWEFRYNTSYCISDPSVLFCPSGFTLVYGVALQRLLCNC